MPTTIQRPRSAPRCEIAGTISYNLLESVPIRFITTASPFAETMWQAMCAYCQAHCIAYRISLLVDGKLVESRAEKEYLINQGEGLN